MMCFFTHLSLSGDCHEHSKLLIGAEFDDQQTYGDTSQRCDGHMELRPS